MRARRRSQIAGFTLIEIMVVVVILGVLSTLVVTNVGSKASKAKVDATKVLLNQVAADLEHFKLSHGRYPDSLDDLVAMPAFITKRDAWPKGGYRRSFPEDAWGIRLGFRRTSSESDKEFDLVSFGADGKEGGEGVDADIAF